jgi:hypothetical protein
MIHLAGVFILGVILGASVAGLVAGCHLARLRFSYPHLDDAFELVDKMRSRGL